MQDRVAAACHGSGAVPRSPGPAAVPVRRADALRCTPLGRRFPDHVRATALIAPGETVLVAVSGGIDSVVLLHLLRFRLEDWALRLVAAHFDHDMREGSDADAAWVAGLCRAWRIPLVRGHADGRLRGETAARDARYRFLAAAAARCGATRIATAHHADDQAETVLFRILRGTGLPGLAGIPAARGPYVRPLLPFRRTDIHAYAAAAGLRWREDPTNRDLRFSRNRLRHEVLPRLEAAAPGATDALLHLARCARAAENAWDRLLDSLESEAILAEQEGVVVLARPALLSYYPHARSRLLRRIFRRLGALPGRGGTRAAVEFTNSGRSGASIRVAGGIRLEREFDRIRVSRVSPQAEPTADRSLSIPAPANGAGDAVVGGRRLCVRWTLGQDRDSDDAVALPLAGTRFPLEVRSWRPGDRIRLSYGTKKLKKLFHERRLARSERHRIPVLADAGGRVLWVVGVARATPSGSGEDAPVLRIAMRDAGTA
ncbi:MAG TPA: tRNA lysidine(34) synthetase TilS [Longimicrobiales bacterium]